MANQKIVSGSAILGLFLLVLLVWVYFIFFGFQSKPYKVFYSPKGNHQIKVYARKSYLAFPGGSGDAPGKVILAGPDGSIINSKEVGMVQLVDDPEWTTSGVSVKLIFD